MTLKFIIGIIFFYILIRLVARFVIPIFQMTRQANRAMNAMKQKMREMENQMNNTHSANTTSKNTQRRIPADEEYIDFEEIKK